MTRNLNLVAYEPPTVDHPVRRAPWVAAVVVLCLIVLAIYIAIIVPLSGAVLVMASSSAVASLSLGGVIATGAAVCLSPAAATIVTIYGLATAIAASDRGACDVRTVPGYADIRSDV